MNLTTADLIRIEGKLDRILDALGLTDSRRLAPCEIQEMAKFFVKEHKQKRKRGDDYEHSQSS